MGIYRAAFIGRVPISGTFMEFVLYLKLVYREQVLFNNLVHEGGTDPNKLVCVIDGWDTISDS
jgi:hypothetical protein